MSERELRLEPQVEKAARVGRISQKEYQELLLAVRAIERYRKTADIMEIEVWKILARPSSRFEEGGRVRSSGSSSLRT